MKKVVLTISTLAAIAFGASQALAAAPHHAAAPKTLVVAMHDPGCHVFLVHGKYLTKASVAGPVRLENMDEKTLKVEEAHHGGVLRIPVGKSLLLQRGDYVVMMFGQAVDDNYLQLTVK